MRIIVLFFALILTGCHWAGINGDGPVVEREVEQVLAPFDALAVEEDLQVYLTYGTEPHIFLKGQSNILDVTRLQVQDGMLTVDYERNVNRHEGVEVHLQIDRRLNYLSLAGESSFEADSANCFAEDLIGIDLAGSSQARGIIVNNATEVRISLAGSSYLKGQLNTETVKILQAGASDVSMDCQAVYADLYQGGSSVMTGDFLTKILKIKAEGASQMRLYGFTDQMDATLSGSSAVNGEKFQCQQLDINMMGSAYLGVSCQRQISGFMSGSSELRYSGLARISVSTTGSALITKY
ncbi:GIN domain-containing protein [Persicobacter psychrovividus]|uniref:Putative auto-transporter adhesin head GIN domain-containing protein n=1 Tax=Persicobacter psychrovividus TaxID=387638 RepID=A0ABN6L9J7_9BACT|nr:hypothetical protein PEPS_21780 [Persicobacter psychrovividus]